MNKEVKVIGVESLGNNNEKFECVINYVHIDIYLNRIRQKETFELCMDAMRDNKMISKEDLFKEVLK